MKYRLLFFLIMVLLLSMPPCMGQPVTYSHFSALDPGSVQPLGWMQTYMQTIAGGWPLLYAKERVPVVYDQYWVRNGMTGDYASYFGDSIIRLSHLLPNSELATQQLNPWLAQVLASQESDGYLGGYPVANRWGNGPDGGDQWLEIFAGSVMLQGLLYHYQCTKAPSILNACERSAGRIIQAYYQPESEVKHYIFGSHGTIVVRAMRTLYLLTGKLQYRDFAKEVLDNYGKVNSYMHWYDDNNYDCVGGGHGVIEEEHVSFPATVYEMTGDDTLRRASIAGWEMINKYVQVDGQPTCNEALVKPVPQALLEHCAAVDWTLTNHEFVRILGDVKYADAAERALFNAYPAAKSPDTMTYAYMHMANQLVATEWAHPRDFERTDWISRTYFSSAHLPLCCPVNSPRAVAYFNDNMVYRTSDGGLAIAYYGPARISTTVNNAGPVELVMDTQYPFEDTVRITVNPATDASFPIQLRVPGWCSSANLTLNGAPLSVTTAPGRFATISRMWHAGDLLTLSMQVPIKLVEYPERASYAGGIAVERGPLTFVLPVEEDWQSFDAPWVHGPAHDSEHKSYRILPKSGATWNYALIVDKANPESSFTLKTFPANANAVLWQDPQLGLEVQARRVLNWKAAGTSDQPDNPELPYKPMTLSQDVTTLTLVPFGCTKLRVSYLPYTSPGDVPQPAIVDTFSRADSQNLGSTESPIYPWIKNANEPATTGMKTEKLYFGAGPMVGSHDWGAYLGGGFAAGDLEASVTMHTYVEPTQPGYTGSGIYYRETDPSGTLGTGYFAMNSYNVEIVLRRQGWSVHVPNPVAWDNPAQSHVLRVRALGTHHWVYVDGIEVISVDDPGGPIAPGFVGLMRNQGRADFDDFLVQTIAPPARCILSGIVSELGTGVPIVGATVKLDNGTTATTGSDGRYSISDLDYAAYNVCAYDDSHPGVIKPITLDSTSANLDFQVNALPVPITINDSFDRLNSTANLGWTDAPNAFHWVAAPNEHLASISGNQMRLGDPSLVGLHVGVGLAGLQTANLDCTLKMHCGLGGASYVSAGLGYRDPGPGVGDVGMGYYALSHLGAGMHLWRTDASVIAGVVWQPYDYSNLSETHTLRVRAIGPHHQIWQDSCLLIDYFDWNGNNAPGYISFLRNAGWATFDSFQATVYPEVAAGIAAVKSLSDGTALTLGGTAGSPIVSKKYTGFFYIEDPSRVCGIKVVSSAAVNVGDAVQVTGTIGTASGERFIQATDVNSIGSGDIKPLGASGKAVASSRGLSSVGLLMTVWGKLSGPLGQPYAIVNDGSSAVGIKISIPSGSVSSAKYGKYVKCTGVVGMPGGVPVVQLNSDDDVLEIAVL